MKYRLANLAWMGGLTLAALGLYLVKYSVQDVQREVVQMRAELAAQRDNVHVLKAEWAYLNRPERLRQLAEAFDQVEPISGVQIIDVQRLPVINVSSPDDLDPAMLQPVSAHSTRAGGVR